MDPFLPTWLAQHPVPLAIAAVQTVFVVQAVRQRRTWVALTLATAVAIAGVWLGPSLWALAQNHALPAPRWSDLGAAAPFLAVTGVAMVRRESPEPLKLRSTLGFVLFPHGLAAIAMALTLVASAQLQSTRSRHLAAGLVTWAATDVVHNQRFVLRSMLPLGDSHATWTVGAIEAGLAATAWVAVGTWMLADPPGTTEISAEQRMG